MPIGNIIREKRKEKGYTQEQVADYLGVSAPAVNKWEKGTSYPDISLLSPIARLLETDLNTLLCFEEEMTEKEMDTFCNQMMEEIQKNGFKSGFLMGEEKIRNYPNCGTFIQKIAVLLDGARLIYGLSDPAEDQHYYEERIEKFYERASRVGEGEAKAEASFMLASKYMAGERYEEARELLETLPDRSSIDKRQIETQILIREERYEEAKKLLERQLLQQVTETQGILWNLQEVEIRQGNREAAVHLADVAGAYGKLMELWDYNQYVAPFQSALSARDTDECLKLLEQMLEAALNIWDLRDTFLYRDLAVNTSQEGEKEQERKKLAGKISEKAEDDVKEKGIIRSGKGEKCRESDAGIDSLHFQCYNGKQPGGVNMRNHEVKTRQPLLDENGSLREPGWSRSQVQIYDRKQIKARRFRIKEWDYYLVMNEEFAGAFTISDDGYIGLQSVSLLNFKEGWEHTETILNPFPMGKFHLPASSEYGDTIYRDKRLHMDFLVTDGKRQILCNFRNFYQGKTFSCNITLEQPKMDTMVIATPWKEKKTAFYYNQKINCMPAYGTMTFDGKTYEFSKESDFGTLDWGRGVWTYDNRWYWGSGNTRVDGKPFGFNIGYGFGNTEAASENMLFYDGKAHKLDDVTFHIPENDYMKPWKFTSSDGRFEMDFTPVLDRAARTSALVILTDQHQVFGRMSGKAVLDDGRVIEMKDVMCFAEDVHNRY